MYMERNKFVTYHATLKNIHNTLMTVLGKKNHEAIQKHDIKLKHVCILYEIFLIHVHIIEFCQSVIDMLH